MNPFVSYLLKVSLGLVIVAVPYYFMLRRDPNLSLKRMYFLFGIIASWLFPLLKIQRPEALGNSIPVFYLDPMAGEAAGSLAGAQGSIALPADILPEAAGNFSLISLIGMIYILGCALLLAKDLFMSMKWMRLWHREHDQHGIAYTNGDQVFTLFSRIFLPGSYRDREDLDSIILHERAHVRQLHFIDLLIVELTLLLTWFNPLSWLISRMIKENHEHLADRQVLSDGVHPAYYRAQLVNLTLGVNALRLGNHFNHSLTSNRFNMMKKPRRSLKGIAKIAFLTPILLLTVAMTTGEDQDGKTKTINGKVIFAETGEPAPGTSIVIRNGTTGCVTDLEGAFRLEVEGDPELVFSFVGFKTQVVRSSKIGRKPVKLEAEPYLIDLQAVQTAGISFTASNMMTVDLKDSKEKAPVILLDGKVVIEIDELDPNSIESITVLKDPENELVQKYNAKNGLIIIQTKSGTFIANDPGKVTLKSAGEVVDEEVFYVVEDMPGFPGGRPALKSFIYSKLVYPEQAKLDGTEGEVLVKFLVDVDGKVRDQRVHKSDDPVFDQAALDIFMNMPDWKPGAQRGKKVAVELIIPVVFELEKK